MADFSGSPTSGDAPLDVQFTDLTTNSPTSWSWTFGDGGTSTAQNPSYTYTAAGTYSSWAQVDADGNAVERDEKHINWDPISAEKQGYKHFMLKEIFEQPAVIERILEHRGRGAESVDPARPSRPPPETNRFI